MADVLLDIKAEDTVPSTLNGASIGAPFDFATGKVKVENELILDERDRTMHTGKELATVKTENFDASSEDVLSADMSFFTSTDSQFLDSNLLLKKEDLGLCFDLVKKVKVEKQVLSEVEDGSNYSENGTAMVKTANFDASSEDIPSADLSFFTSNSQFLDSKLLMKKEDLGVCFDLVEKAKVENQILSEVERGINDSENGVIKSEVEGEPSRDVSFPAESIPLATANSLFENTNVLMKQEGSEKAEEYAQVVRDFHHSCEGKEDSCHGNEPLSKADMNARAGEFSCIGDSSQEPAVSLFVNSKLSQSSVFETNTPVPQSTSCSNCSSKLKFSCKDCPVSFPSKYLLNQHTFIHVGMRPHPCTFCNASFQTKDHLQVHASVHLPCAKCHATFQAKQLLKQHGIIFSENKTRGVTAGKTETSPRFSTISENSKSLSSSSGRFVNISLLTKEKDAAFSCQEKEIFAHVGLDFHASFEDTKNSQCSDKALVQTEMNRRVAKLCVVGSHSEEIGVSSMVDIGASVSESDKSVLPWSDPSVCASGGRFSCMSCPKSFKRKWNLKEHAIAHSNEKPFSCTQCSSKFKSRSALRYHMITHSSERPLGCAHCTSTFKTKGTLKQHLLLHSSEKPFTCSHCPARFAQKWSLKTHLVTHSREKQFMCAHCPARFTGKSNLNAHLAVHSGEKPFNCELCLTRFTQKRNLKQHLASHSGDKPFNCTECPSRFTRKFDMKQHLITHSGEKPFICTDCPARFNRKHSLKLHMVTHTREKLFMCAHCPARFSRKSYLKEHLPNHFGGKPFICDHCPARFTNKFSLKRHIVIHLGEKPFMCPQCPARYSWKSHLKRHLAVHSGEKPFICDKCPARYTVKNSLKRHLITHSGKKPFICELCPARFTRKGYLKMHLVVHSARFV